MKTKKSEFVADQITFAEAAVGVKKRDKAISESGASKGGQTKVFLSFGYGKGSVPYLAADFDAPLEDFSEYSHPNSPEIRASP